MVPADSFRGVAKVPQECRESGLKSRGRSGTLLAPAAGVANPDPKAVPLTSTPSTERPVCDEWGFYDPEQAGFEAVLRRLTDEDDDAGTSVAPAPTRPARLP